MLIKSLKSRSSLLLLCFLVAMQLSSIPRTYQPFQKLQPISDEDSIRSDLSREHAIGVRNHQEP